MLPPTDGLRIPTSDALFTLMQRLSLRRYDAAVHSRWRAHHG
jgi:hypothetical protein